MMISLLPGAGFETTSYSSWLCFGLPVSLKCPMFPEICGIVLIAISSLLNDESSLDCGLAVLLHELVSTF